MRCVETKRLVRRACKMQHFDAIFQQQQQHHEVATCSTQKQQQQTIATTDGYCGRVISGLSLLSASVMRMRHKSAELGQLCVADLLLSRRSLYRLSGSARYDFTHALLGAEESRFGTQTVPRERRIALICREVVVPTAKSDQIN
ncbi:hypothetical protein niasHS_004897 [Heterodera schachtii]|uniref:Uncharacterized protein n=1 Tax=Heterodera schachtii TaxID=97005 RepID=A0ABD2JJB9_HETSC